MLLMLPMLPIFMYTDKVIPLSLLNIKTGEEDTDKMVKFTTYNLLSLLIIQTGGMIQTGFIICIPLSPVIIVKLRSRSQVRSKMSKD